MITVKDFMECVSYRITDGAKYEWSCYGPDARSMDYWNGEHGDTERNVNMVYDTRTQVVYQMEAWDMSNDRAYRWIHPDYLEEVTAEAEENGVDFEQSYDHHKFTDLEVEEDMLEKATAIANEEEYDNRIMVTLTLGYDEQHLLMEMAHEADMSLNKYVEHILRLEMQKHGIEV
jgi:predicted HicB family RNase H-like nuclease